MVLDITTQGNAGLTGSETSACKGKLSSGNLTPAMSMTTLVLPAATTPTFFAAMNPRDVSTPVTAPDGPRLLPVTSQFSRISTPRASAARAYPHATASCRAVPPRRCNAPPRMGYRMAPPTFNGGQNSVHYCGDS